MPTYDYGCTQCNHIFETTHKMSESPLIPCPQCGGITEKKISRGAGLVFKGSGFFVTDYSNSSSSSSSEGFCATEGPCGAPACAMNQNFDIPD